MEIAGFPRNLFRESVLKIISRGRALLWCGGPKALLNRDKLRILKNTIKQTDYDSKVPSVEREIAQIIH